MARRPGPPVTREQRNAQRWFNAMIGSIVFLVVFMTAHTLRYGNDGEIWYVLAGLCGGIILSRLIRRLSP